jgi:hypothetical protein
MKINKEHLDKILEEVRKNPNKMEELLKDIKPIHSIFGQDDGIPPRFKPNFRKDPGWEKVSGLDFEAIGRILVCHLYIEHYIEKLIELSTPPILDWDSPRLTFSQKFKLVRKIRLLKESKFDRGIDIVNSIRNKSSHDLMSKIDKSKIEELKSILFEFERQGKKKEELSEVRIHFDLFDVHAIIERFTLLVCSLIGGYCMQLVGGTVDAETFIN